MSNEIIPVNRMKKKTYPKTKKPKPAFKDKVLEIATDVDLCVIRSGKPLNLLSYRKDQQKLRKLFDEYPLDISNLILEITLDNNYTSVAQFVDTLPYWDGSEKDNLSLLDSIRAATAFCVDYIIARAGDANLMGEK